MRSLWLGVAALTSSVADAQTAPPASAAAPTATTTTTSMPVMPSYSTYATPRLRNSDGRFLFANDPARTFASSRFYANLYSQVKDYGRCLSSISGKGSRRLLETAPNTADERAQFVRLIAGSRACLSYGYLAPTVFLRAGVAEALVRREFASGRSLSKDAGGQAAIRFLDAEQRRSKARLIDDYRFTSLTNCIVLQAPEAVQKVMLSRVGSQEENHAIEAAVEGAPTCSSTRKLPSLASRPFIRAYLAESAYRWSMFAS